MKSEGWKVRLRRVLSYMGRIAKDKKRKSIPRIMAEFLAASIRTKGVATHYFTSFLYRKDAGDYRDHLSQKEMRRPQVVLCEKNAIDILHNKLLCQLYFEKAGFRFPRLIAYNFQEVLYFADDARNRLTGLADPERMREAIRVVVAKSATGSIFIKPINSACGVGARKISIGAEGLSGELLMELVRSISSGSFVFQDEVIQHGVLSSLNASSLNTIRIDTFKNASSNPEMLSGYLRIGGPGSFVDNVSAGGMYVGIDMETGTLKEKARRNLKSGADIYFSHPASGIVFKGLALPYFADVKTLVLGAASLLPAAMIGWDVAIAADGPILMEGNAIFYGVQTHDIVHEGYRKNPVYQKVLAAYKNVKKTARKRM